MSLLLEAPPGAARARPLRAADRLVAMLEARGVDRVFGIPGGAISPMFDALIDSAIEPIVCQHESMALYMAYGHARATGKPAVVLVTSGPGVLNALTGIAAARLDEVPLVLIAGDVSRSAAGRGALQDGGPSALDLMHAMRPFAKEVLHVHSPERAGLALETALASAAVHPRGPVVVNLPVDVASAAASGTALQMNPGAAGRIDAETAARIGELLATAERPALLLGLGARLTDVRGPLVRIAERCCCPVIADIEAKGVFPESHPLSLGIFGVGGGRAAITYLTQGHDLLVSVGARLSDPNTNDFSDLLRPDGLWIQLDHSADRLSSAYTPDLAIHCDMEDALRRLDAATPCPDSDRLRARDQAVREARRSEPAVAVRPLRGAPHHPPSAVRALQRILPGDTVFTSDIGNHLVVAAQHLILETPRFHLSQGLGGMGSGIGTAMGLALALRGERTVVGICGDGGLLMVGNELATCARYGIPVILAVLDDGRLGMVQHGVQALFGRTADYSTGPIDILGYARALGVRATRIDSDADLEEIAEIAGAEPLLLQIPIDPEYRVVNPREGAFSFPPPMETRT